MLKKNLGFTFVELMIALVINALLFSALIAIFIANIRHYNKTINTNRLNQQLQMTLWMMSNDIRRAGYWGNANTDVGIDQNNNPFVSGTADISVNGSNNCILFTYDHDNNGTLPAISSNYDDERYGYRLNGQTIQTRPPGALFDCNAGSAVWENVTDPNIIQITSLVFTLTTKTVATGPSTTALITRSVDITITGRLASDTTITKTLTQHVRIRNDKFVP